eukprot:s1825_g7.t1
MVLVTFQFIGLAHLHSLWGCLVFVRFPLGLAWLVWVFAPLVSFLRCWLVFRWAVCTFGMVWASWPPDAMESFVPVGPLLSEFMACFRCGPAAAAAAPSLCAVYLGAVQIKVHAATTGAKVSFASSEI